jgi:D-alanyl-D-alanine carboxypeptidase
MSMYDNLSRDQLIAELQARDRQIATLTLDCETAWRRYHNANRMAQSYMNEFADRGLVYMPKIKSGDSE